MNMTLNSYINLRIIRSVDGTAYTMPYFINGIDKLARFMRQAIYGKELFHREYVKASGARVKTPSSLGSELCYLHDYSQLYSKDYKFSPLIEFFFEQYRNHPIKDYILVLDIHDPDNTSADIFNDFITTMRANAVATKLKRKVSDWESKSTKNEGRLIKFDRELFKRYARVLVIRLDCNYHKAIFTEEEVQRLYKEALESKERDQVAYLAGEDIYTPRVIEGRITLEEVQEDRERLFRNIKGKPSLFRHLVAYIWRIEFGREAGYHLHLMFFFDGAYVQKHEHLAQEIGNYWRDDITEGRSYFENCNRKRPKYGESWALGQVDHWEVGKRENLLHAMKYFCKANQLVQVLPYKGCHLFGSGFVHRQRKVHGGRPRTKGVVGSADNQWASR